MKTTSVYLEFIGCIIVEHKKCNIFSYRKCIYCAIIIPKLRVIRYQTPFFVDIHEKKVMYHIPRGSAGGVRGDAGDGEGEGPRLEPRVELATQLELAVQDLGHIPYTMPTRVTRSTADKKIKIGCNVR